MADARPLIVARTAAAALTFVIPLMLARAFSLPEYGTYKQLFLVAMTLRYVVPLGMPHALYYFIPRTDRRRPFFGQTLAFLLVAGTVGGLLVAAAVGPLSRHFSNPDLLQYRWPLGAYVALLVGACTLEASLTTQGRTREAAAAYLIFDGLRAAAMVAPALLGYGLRGTMNAILLFGLLRLGAAVALVVKGTDGPLWERGRLREQLAHALPLGAGVMIAIPQQYAHQYAVSATMTPELFAVYAVGCFQLPLVDLLYTPTCEVLMVHLGRLEKEGRFPEAVRAFQEATARLAFVFVPLAAFLVVTAPEMIAFLFGPRFLDAVPLFRVSVISVVLAVIPVESVLRARNETRHLFRVSAIKALLTVPLVFVGVTRFGMLGAISAWAATELVGKVLLCLRLPRAMQAPLRALLPWASVARAGLAAAAAAAAVLLAGRASPFHLSLPADVWLWRLVPLALAGTLFAACYLGGLRLAGVSFASAFAWVRRRAAL